MCINKKSAARRTAKRVPKTRSGLPAALALAISVSVFSSSLAAAADGAEESGPVFEPVVTVEYFRASSCPYALSDVQPPDAGYIEGVISESFETQDLPLFVNGAAYPFAVRLSDGAVLVSAKEFLPLLYSVEWSENAGCFTAEGEGFSFSAREGDVYVEVNGRCLPCSRVELDADLGVLVDISAVSSALSLSAAMKNGECFVSGEAKPAEDAETYYSEEELYWLSHIISAESMTEPLSGKIAVGNVVLNRAASDLFPDSVKEVVLDRRYGIVQFSPVAAGTVYNEPDAESVVAAKLCLEGVTVSDEIIFFMNPALATSSWISDNREAVVTIGRHTFYS